MTEYGKYARSTITVADSPAARWVQANAPNGSRVTTFEDIAHAKKLEEDSHDVAVLANMFSGNTYFGEELMFQAERVVKPGGRVVVVEGTSGGAGYLTRNELSHKPNIVFGFERTDGASRWRMASYEVGEASVEPPFNVVCGFDSFNDENDVRRAFWYPKKNDVVFDVGACFGSFALPAAAAGAEVWAFEPYPELWPLLQSNIDANPHLKSLIARVEYGLHKKQMTLTSDMWAKGAEKIEVRSLDEVFPEMGLTHLDWLKIDVEGHEAAVLEGGEETIRKYKPTLLIECHTFHGVVTDKIEEQVRALGYAGEIVQRKRIDCEHLFVRGQ
jgi:FkbM family methyltransferase